MSRTQIGIGIAGLIVLIVAFFTIKDAFDDRAELRIWQADMITAVGNASANPRVNERSAIPQVYEMGVFIRNLRDTVQNQNKAVADLGEARNRALAHAEEQARLRREVIQQSQSLSTRLRTEALTPANRNNLEAELRRVQDQAYEAGL